jgi:hypothetical protein
MTKGEGIYLVISVTFFGMSFRALYYLNIIKNELFNIRKLLEKK